MTLLAEPRLLRCERCGGVIASLLDGAVVVRDGRLESRFHASTADIACPRRVWVSGGWRTCGHRTFISL